MNAIAHRPPVMTGGALIPGWRWRQRQGPPLCPSEMVTRHLFYTLRMIWNHSMPLHMQVGQNIQRYRFGPEYTLRYMREAIAHIGTELSGRPDIAPWMMDELEQMWRWLRDVPQQRFIQEGDALALPAS